MPRAALQVVIGLYVLLRLAINPRHSARAGPSAVISSRERSASTSNSVEVYHDETKSFIFKASQRVFHI